MGGQSPLLNPSKGSKLKRYADHVAQQIAKAERPVDLAKAIDVIDYIFDKPPVFRTPHWLYRDLLLRSEMEVLHGKNQTDEVFSDPKFSFLLDEITATRLKLAKRNATPAEKRWKPKQDLPPTVLVVCAALFEAILAQEQTQPLNRVYVTVARRLGLTREVVKGVAKRFVLRSDVYDLTLMGAIQTAGLMAEADKKKPHGFAALPMALSFQTDKNSDGNTQIERRLYSRAIREIEKCQMTP